MIMLKRTLAFFLIVTILFSLAGCNGNGIKEVDGQYYDKNGLITDVTLDVIAQAHHKKTFEKCNETKRQDVLRRYATYHAAAYGISQDVIDKIFSYDLRWKSSEALGLLQEAMDETNSVLPLVNLYYEAKGEEAFGDFADKMDSITDAAGTAFQVSHTVCLIFEMSHQTIDNPQQYCDVLIDSLASITGYIPVFGDFYGQALDAVGEGLQMLIENSKNRDKVLGAYEDLFDPNSSGFLTKITGTANYEFIAHPDKWDDSSAPTLEMLAARKSEFPRMSALELQYVREYILYRLSHDLEPKKTPAGDTDVPTVVPVKTGNWYGYGNTVTTSHGRVRFDLEVIFMNDISIRGILTRSHLFNVQHTTEFSGKCTVVDGKWQFAVNFFVPTELGTIPTYTYESMTIVYDPATDLFTTGGCYKVTMQPVNSMSLAPVTSTRNWSGIGTDDFYNALHDDGHLFELKTYALNESEISGRLIVSYEGKVDHDTYFSGRGIGNDKYVYYEILMDTPRSVTWVTGTVFTMDRAWIRYDRQKDSFSFLGVQYYSATMDPIA